MPKIKAVVFDWGGVLMQTTDHSPRWQWDGKLGLPPGSVESVVHNSSVWIQAQLGKISPDDYWMTIGDTLKLNGESLSALRREFYQADRLNSDLIALIARLKRGTLQIGLLSNNSVELRTQMKTLGLESLFDAVVISGELGVMKPAKKAYQAVLSQLQVLPEQAVMIDDTPDNVQGARKVGMRAIKYTSQAELAAELEQNLQV